MSLYDWLLFLHVLAATALVAGVVVFGVVVLDGAGAETRRALGAPAVALWNAGGLGVLVFGVWLAFEVDAYELWDGWIVAALVLWFAGSAAAGPLSRAMRDDTAALDPRRARLLFAVAAVATAALLIDMIFKPGA